MNPVAFMKGEEGINDAPHHYTGCGLDNVYLLNGFAREVFDGEEAVAIEDLDGLWDAIGDAIVTSTIPLAPAEVRFLREHMDATQEEIAAKLGVSAQSVARWEKGQTDIPGPADRFLRMVYLAFQAERASAAHVQGAPPTVIEAVLTATNVTPSDGAEHDVRLRRTGTLWTGRIRDAA